MTNNSSPSERLILVTNDDGITAKGIRTLVEAVRPFGKIVVVAPDSPQSAMGHAITINKPLRLTQVSHFQGIEAYACSGTPVDCVKLAVSTILDRRPDLCVSGINHGSNAASNVIYSGTMSAAMEAAMEGTPSVGFSLLDFKHDADMSAAKKYVELIVGEIIKKGMNAQNLINVNIPALPFEEIKGVKICRQANARWREEYVERLDPFGRKYYWLTGKFINFDKGTNTDIEALEAGYVSIVPVKHDLTDYKDMAFLEENWKF